MIHGDASEVYHLANDLATIGAKAVRPLRSAMAQGGQMLAKQWQDNATEHFDRSGHAKNYPKTITSDLTFGIGSVTVEAGPDKLAGNQAFLGQILEFGGEHSPAYLDGLRAQETVAPLVEELVATVVLGTFVAATPVSATTLQEYTTKAGVTRMATPAQIANWTRGR